MAATGTGNGAADTASLNTIVAALAGLTATVNGMQGQIVETRQDMRDVKASLGTLVPQAVYDVTTRDLAARVASVETRQAGYVTADIFAARVKVVDADLAELRGTLTKMPDTRRQQMALLLSATAILIAATCSAGSIIVTIFFQVFHH